MENLDCLVFMICTTIILSIFVFKLFEYSSLRIEIKHKKEMEELRFKAKDKKEQAFFNKNNIKTEIKKEFEEEIKKEVKDKIDKNIEPSLTEKIKSLEKQIKIIANTTKNQ